MKLIRFDRDAGRALNEFGSTGAILTRILRAKGPLQVVAIHLSPGGQIGNHPAVAPQLFLVVEGTGWVTGGDNTRDEIGAGQGAYWEAGEYHAASGVTAMSAIIIEGQSLELALAE